MKEAVIVVFLHVITIGVLDSIGFDSILNILNQGPFQDFTN